MINSTDMKLNGLGKVVKVPSWSCVKCGRNFKLPKVPGSCETMFSICMTCFAISCTEMPEEDSAEKS